MKWKRKELDLLTLAQLALAMCIGAGLVVWYELVKLIKHLNKNKKEVK